MNRITIACLASTLLVCFCVRTLSAEDKPSVPLITLKLDDLGHHSKDPQVAVPPHWQRVTDFLNEEKIKANYGIISETLNDDCPAYIAWLKERAASGMIEFWNHGYYNRFPSENPSAKIGEYLNRPVEQQAESLKKSQELVKEKTGIEMKAFGPHAIQPDANFYPALATRPEIQVVFFYGPPKDVKTGKILIERRAELESPIFKPNPAQLKEKWEKLKSFDYLAVQGHPNTWGDAEFANFKEYIKFLKEQGCRFVTVSEFLTLTGKAKP